MTQTGMVEFSASMKPGLASWVSALGVLWAAFALRLIRLTEQNIWWDEGWTLWLSQESLKTIALRTSTDEHPPLHYWLMHGWGHLVGFTAFGGRIFSVLFGVLTLALAYCLGRRVGGARLGLWVMLFLSLARFHVWWSQDIKNYTLSGFFALAGAYCALIIWTSPRPLTRHWVGYIASLAIALYSHYLAALVLLATNLFAGLWLAFNQRVTPQPWRRAFTWGLAQAGVLLAFAPWLWFYLTRASEWPASAIFDFGIFSRLALTLFALGETYQIERFSLSVLAISSIAGLGLTWLSGRYERRAAGAWLGFFLVFVPPLLIYLLALTPVAAFAPKIQARYLLVFLPGYGLLLALGLLRLRSYSRWLSLVALIGILAAQSQSLANYYRSRSLRDDYFTLVNVVNDFAQPGDVVFLHTSNDWPVFLYYLRAPIPWEGLPAGSPALLEAPAAADLVAGIFTRHSAVWMITTPAALQQDPHHWLAQALAHTRPLQYEEVFNDKRLALYASEPRSLNHVPERNFLPQEARTETVAPGLILSGINWPTHTLAGGETLRVVTYWNAHRPTTLTLEAQAAEGEVLIGETLPLNSGERVRQQHTLHFPTNFEGAYRLVIRVETHEYLLGAGYVHRRTPPPLRKPIRYPTDYVLGEGLRLIGYHLPSIWPNPGDPLPLTLFWRADQAISASYKVFVHFVGPDFNLAQNNFLWGQVDNLPLNGEWPTSAWPPGVVLADEYQVPLAPDAPPGCYQIVIGLYDPVTGERLRVFQPDGQALGDAIWLAAIRTPSGEIFLPPASTTTAPIECPSGTPARN